jgi:hypothetical protein
MRKPLFTGARGTVGAVLAAVTLAACSTSDTTAPLTRASTIAEWTGNELVGYVRVCKAGGPAGTYTFNISVEGGGDYFMNWGPTTTLEFDGSTVVCKGVYNAIINDTWDDTETAKVTVTETLGEGMTVPMIEIYNVILPFPGYVTTLYNTNTVTVTTSPVDRFKLNFFNEFTPPPPPGGFGCTPGYWKQSQHFASWVPTGLTPAQTVGSVFSNAAIYGLGSATLVQGLSFKGGSTLTGAAGNLLRAAIAAQLNARHSDVGAPLTAAAMVASVNAALASGDRDAMLALASELDRNNNLGCMLN